MYVVTIRRIPKAVEDPVIIDKPTYSKVSREWSKKTDWPCRTNLNCYSCGFVTSRKLFFIPVIYSNSVYSRGNSPLYCHPACAVWTLLHSGKNRDDVSRYMQLIQDLCTDMTGVRGGIVASPNPENLERFGGTMSDRDFQNHICEHNTQITKALYPDLATMHAELSA